MLRLAFGVAPGDAAAAFWTALRGRRVRGWNTLYLLAARHPLFYDHWLRRGEPGHFKEFCKARNSGPIPLIACIVLDTGNDADAIRTVRSIFRGLPRSTRIWTNVPALAETGETVLDPGASLGDVLGDIDIVADWVLPLVAGDMISPRLGSVLACIAPDPKHDALLFWDEDCWSDGKRHDPWIKPDWDPVLHRARDGITGAAMISTDVALRHAEAFRFDVPGVAKLTTALLADERIHPRHIPLILSHRSVRLSSPRPMSSQGSTALEDSDSTMAWPIVSIIIPTRDRADLLATCLSGLSRLVYRGGVELLIVDNGSTEDATHRVLAKAEGDGARIVRHAGPFNYAAMMNGAASAATGQMLCLLNNDIEMSDGDWLTHMVRYAMRDQVGAVGARLLYPTGEIQHAGIVIGIGGAAGHVQKGVRPTATHFADWHAYSRTVSAVTGACLVVSKAKFSAAGGFDEAGFRIDFNDVDFCLRLETLGLTNILAVEATLIHHESKSRGLNRTPDGAAQFSRELELLRSRWRSNDFKDPRHSPMFRKECERCVLAF